MIKTLARSKKNSLGDVLQKAKSLKKWDIECKISPEVFLRLGRPQIDWKVLKRAVLNPLARPHPKSTSKRS